MKLHDMRSCGLEAIASRVDALASDVAGVGVPAIQLSGEDTWIGPAADDAKVALASLTRATVDTSVELRGVARELRARAAELAAIEATEAAGS